MALAVPPDLLAVRRGHPETAARQLLPVARFSRSAKGTAYGPQMGNQPHSRVSTTPENAISAGFTPRRRPASSAAGTGASTEAGGPAEATGLRWPSVVSRYTQSMR